MMIENLTPTEYETLLRQDFSTFAARCFHNLNPQTEFAMNWHVEVIAAKLTAVRQGKIRRLIINKPDRFDFIEFIFHPMRYRRPICVSRRQSGGMSKRRPAKELCGFSRPTARPGSSGRDEHPAFISIRREARALSERKR